MAGANNKPARSIQTGRGRPGKPNGVVPALGHVQIKGSGGSGDNGIGMSAEARARLLGRLGRPIPLADLLKGKALGDEDVIVDGAPVDAPTPAFDETLVKQYLGVNVLPPYCTPVQRSGWVTFNNSPGSHTIPLGSDGNSDKLIVQLQQTLLVTSFQAYAALSNPGLPGAYVEIDPASLIGQVAFYLQSDSGTHPYPETTFAGSQPGNGTELVNVPSVNISPPFSDISTTNVRGAYDVLRSPFPGFPAIVGIKMRGYILPRELFLEALECASAGGCDQ